ncbi:hypothetical protein [Aquimarina sp. 2201CG14-23]|uniref:hypothetical protein n=1 Tax=Aquimarina mycalae TaxID=3040073 RepID=UPI0024781772|nr:hypothetical protein [Aquimarina sp. 2201CG14-23]MDH7448186.1 hypothetical protein [Aquimarina sp. 2201CG14-23]
MKKILCLTIILTISTNLFSQIDSTKVAFVSYWSIGDSYNFKVSKIKQQWKEGKLTKDQKQDYIANFTVIDSTENSYIIKWSYENDLGNTYKIPENLLDKLSKYKITEIKYKTSEVGDLIEILNWKEVGETMSSMFDDIVNVLGDKDEKEKDALKTAMQPFKQIYSSKQGVEQLVLKELQYFHFPMGLEYDITEPLLYDEELPNMFGGNPIKAKAKLYFESVDFEKGFCVVKQEMSLDPNDTKEILKQAFKKMKLDDKGIKKALKTAVFEINDKNTFEYYYNPGVPYRIETIRESIINIDKEKGKRIDKTIIELIYND